MKIAIPTIGGILDETLSSCEVFTIFTVDEANTVTESEILCTPVGCDCKNNIPLTLQQKGVTAILAFELPPHAEEICSQHGITAHAGFSGEICEIIKEFLKIK